MNQQPYSTAVQSADIGGVKANFLIQINFHIINFSIFKNHVFGNSCINSIKNF